MMIEHRLIYLPLGGAGEIGMNAYVYGYGEANRERLIIIDLGVTFPDMEGTPGVDLIFPDISWLEERCDRIEAIFITHAHEDHIGAIGHLWKKLGAPIFARSFTAHIARRKMLECDSPETIVRTASPWPEKIIAGPFEVSFLPVPHSIPESSALVISSPAGRIIHTGDFKLDKSPIVGDRFDEDLWRDVAKSGVKVLVCDSTNIFSNNEGRSESCIENDIDALIARAPYMIVATTFASNIARVKMLAEAGSRAGRSICIMGRAMHRMIETALEAGTLCEFPKVVSAAEACTIPREHLMLLVTGSQGERRAASAQLSLGKYQGIELKEDDLFLFSSKTIPGNERGVTRIINLLSEKGVDVVDDSSGLYHVSGHANRPDLSFMHNLLQPQMVIPMHGEHRHLRAHSKLAEKNGINSVVCINGMMMDLSDNAPKVVEYVETGRVYLDGKVQYGAFDGIMRDRIRIAINGLVIINVLLDADYDPMGVPWVEIRGLPPNGMSNAPIVDILEEDLGQYIGRAGRKILKNDDALEAGLIKIARHSCYTEIGKRPEISVVITRLS